MLKTIAFIFAVYLVLSIVTGGNVAFGGGDWHGMMWDNPLAHIAGGIFGFLLIGVALVIAFGMLIGLIIMAAGLPLAIIAFVALLILMPALLPLAILLGLFMLAFGGLSCLFA